MSLSRYTPRDSNVPRDGVQEARFAILTRKGVHPSQFSPSDFSLFDRAEFRKHCGEGSLAMHAESEKVKHRIIILEEDRRNTVGRRQDI